MNGFKDDVIAILKTNNMLHKEAVGKVFGDGFGHINELILELRKRNLLVATSETKIVLKFSYIIMGSYLLESWVLLKAFSMLSEQGIMILEVTGREKLFEDNSVSLFGKFSTTKVKFEDRTYVVIHTGVDYGN